MQTYRTRLSTLKHTKSGKTLLEPKQLYKENRLDKRTGNCLFTDKVVDGVWEITRYSSKMKLEREKEGKLAESMCYFLSPSDRAVLPNP
mmetsp:Transcript_25706/g.36034  ORF Transcript_25706/g.36034 Transcript_25706/m.36034 type:complete len:89 (+) Transcript_25706:357-623(+)